MFKRGFAIFILAATLITGCSPGEKPDDKNIIEKIAGDIEQGVLRSDLTKIDAHFSFQAKQHGYEANRFLMACSYGDSMSPEFSSMNVEIMGDSARISFILMPTGMQYSDSLPRSVVRLIKTDRWEIASFDLVRNR